MRAHLDLVRGCPGAHCAAAAQQCSAVPIVPAVMSRTDFALLKQSKFKLLTQLQQRASGNPHLSLCRDRKK